MDVISILENNSEYFSQNVLWINALRQIGWLLANGLKNICDACENLFNDMYSLLDFTQYPALQDFFDTFRPLIGAVLILSILALGIMMTMGHSKGMKVFQNLVIFIAVVTALPILMQNLNNIVITGKEAIYSGITAMSNQIMKSDVYDVAYMINNGFDGNDFRVKGNNINESKISTINIVEVMEPGGTVSDNYKELITTKLESMNDDGTWETKKIKDKWFSVFDTPYYFRYHVDFSMLYIGLISLIIAFICTAYKVVRIIFEIVTSYLLAIVFSAEISGGQKIIKILDNLKNLYIALLMVVVMIRIYVLANGYISSTNFGNVTKTFALLFFTLCLIDGPNIIEKLLGIDIGLSSAWGKVMAGAAIARGLGRTASGVAKTARNIAVGNPYAVNSKGGIVGRMKTAFGNVSNSHAPQGNPRTPVPISPNSGFSFSGGNFNTSGSTAAGTTTGGYTGTSAHFNTGTSDSKDRIAGNISDFSNDDKDTRAGNSGNMNHSQDENSGMIITGNENETNDDTKIMGEGQDSQPNSNDGQKSLKPNWNSDSEDSAAKNLSNITKNSEGTLSSSIPADEIKISSENGQKAKDTIKGTGGAGMAGKSENISSKSEPASETGNVSDISEPMSETGAISDISEPATEAGSVSEISEPVSETGVISDISEPVSETGAISDISEPVSETGVISDMSEPVSETGVISNISEPLTEAGSVSDISKTTVEKGVISDTSKPNVKTETNLSDSISEKKNENLSNEMMTKSEHHESPVILNQEGAKEISSEKVLDKGEIVTRGKGTTDIKKESKTLEKKPRRTSKKRQNKKEEQ